MSRSGISWESRSGGGGGVDKKGLLGRAGSGSNSWTEDDVLLFDL
jgi:hypothetical protein